MKISEKYTADNPVGINKDLVQKNQIWQCKKSYNDSFSELNETVHDFVVVVVTEPEDLNGEPFIRARPISFETEFKTEEDILIVDETILGASFIIETWNEQPILTELLEKYMGTINMEGIKVVEPDIYTDAQLDFRKKEIRKTAFLRQSVLSNLAMAESQKESKVIKINYRSVMSIAAVFIGLVFFVWQPTKLSNTHFFEKYAFAYTNTVNVESGSNDLVRGDNYSFEGFSVGESETLLLAMERYDMKDYKGALKLMGSIKDLKNRSFLFYFYYGISQLFSETPQESTSTFQYLANKENISFKSDVLYYLALSYSKEGKPLKARKILKKLNNIDQNYLKEKEQIFDDLRLF